MVLILDSELEVNSPSISLEGIRNDIVAHQIRYRKLYDEANNIISQMPGLLDNVNSFAKKGHFERFER